MATSRIDDELLGGSSTEAVDDMTSRELGDWLREGAHGQATRPGGTR